MNMPNVEFEETIPVESYLYSLTIQISHPAMAPEEITAALGLTPDHAWHVGHPRRTPAGTPLPGHHKQSYWCHTQNIEADRAFFKGALRLLEKLEARSEFVLRLSETGGKVNMNVSLPGDTNIGDVIGWDGLKRFIELKVELGIEVFPGMRLPEKGGASKG